MQSWTADKGRYSNWGLRELDEEPKIYGGQLKVTFDTESVN